MKNSQIEEKLKSRGHSDPKSVSIKHMGFNDVDLGEIRSQLDWAIGQSLTEDTIFLDVPPEVAKEIVGIARRIRRNANAEMIDLDGMRDILLLAGRHDPKATSLEYIFGSDFIRACRTAAAGLSIVK